MITLELVKLHLRVDGEDEDDLIRLYYEAAVSDCAAYLNRPLYQDEAAASEAADKNIVKIIVAGGYEKPYYIKKYGLSEKGAFIRIGSASEPMPSRQIEELFTKRTRYSIGKIKSPKKDLRFQQLQIYYQ